MQGFHTALTGREYLDQIVGQGFTLHPTDEDLSVGTPSWAIFVSSLREELRCSLHDSTHMNCCSAGELPQGAILPAGSVAGLIRAMRPLGPTTKGSERAFQLPSSSDCQVLPSSRLMSEPLGPTVIQSLRTSDH